MDADLFGWVRMDTCARREVKTRQKEPKMGEQGMFYDVCMVVEKKNRKVTDTIMVIRED